MTPDMFAEWSEGERYERPILPTTEAGQAIVEGLDRSLPKWGSHKVYWDFCALRDIKLRREERF